SQADPRLGIPQYQVVARLKKRLEERNQL
ncbi:antitoxin, partial [Acinetobacter baumannii]|nr:antitoxin [Acinetobacter baumannii]